MLQTSIAELTETIVKALVTEPDKVYIHEGQGQLTTGIEITVSAEDVGRVVGREGRTIRALRRLLHACAMRQERRVSVEIVEV